MSRRRKSLEERQKEAFDRWRAAHWLGLKSEKRRREKYVRLLGMTWEEYFAQLTGQRPD